jgi:hypothetical protein
MKISNGNSSTATIQLSCLIPSTFNSFSILTLAVSFTIPNITQTAALIRLGQLFEKIFEAAVEEVIQSTN